MKVEEYSVNSTNITNVITNDVIIHIGEYLGFIKIEIELKSGKYVQLPEFTDYIYRSVILTEELVSG